MTDSEIEITADLIRDLVREQHPDLAGLTVREVAGGWDNQQWRLGDELAVRMPRTERAPYLQRKERRWLPVLAPRLPLPVPNPVRTGEPSARFPKPWTIMTWVPGEPLDLTSISRGDHAAETLAGFLRALHVEAPAEAPTGSDRGAHPSACADGFDHFFRAAAPDDIADAIRAVWDDAAAAPGWAGPPVWVHGDLHPANVVVSDGTLSGVIDFGDLFAGDPAWDLAAAWVLLPAGASSRFFDVYGHADEATIRRARGLAALKSLFLMLMGKNGERGLPGGKPTWGPAGRAALDRVLTGMSGQAYGERRDERHRSRPSPVTEKGVFPPMSTTQSEGDRAYTEGRRYRALTDAERSLLATRVPSEAGARALDVGCGTGELAAYLSASGYTVDAVDWSEAALAEAGTRHGDAARWLRLDVEEDDGTSLDAGGYDLITLRFVAPFLRSRDRVLDALGRRLRPGGALVLITPLASATPAERRGITLSEDELAGVRSRWTASERHDTDGLVLLVLHEPNRSEAPAPTAARPARSSAHERDGSGRHHRFRLLGRCYRQVESGRKTIEVRVAAPGKTAVEVGDTIVFHDRDSGREVDIAVRRVASYASFEELLSGENPARIDPDRSPEDLLADLREIHPPAKESLGVLAFEFDHRPARPGRTMPMTPEEYARTVPHHTVYACLYVRDEHDRPIQLRSVYGSRVWQFPGGNLDAGEDPLQAARREAVEETGLELGPEAPTLLLTHFLHAGSRMPLNKVGFVFDGGRLTSDQLDRIRLDPAEHDMWAVHELAGWRELMTAVDFARLDAVERARHGEGPAYLVTHT